MAIPTPNPFHHLTPEEIADLLWLQAYMWDGSELATKKFDSSARPEPEKEPTIAAADTTGRQSQPPSSTSPTDPPPAVADDGQPATPADQETAPGLGELHLPQRGGGMDSPSRGVPIVIPGGSALPDRLLLARSLRPLLKKKLSRKRVIDEEATAERIAETNRLLTIVTRPGQERWLDLALIIDRSPSMAIWQRTLEDLLPLLNYLGAFRTVQQWTLLEEGGQLVLRVATAPGEPPGRQVTPTSILDPRGEQLILVLSDCLGSPWYDGRAGELLNLWGDHQPTALCQMLPETMWSQTALVNEIDVSLTAPQPAIPNRGLTVAEWPWYWDDQEDRPAGSPVPVVTLDPLTLFNWARLVAGYGNARSPGAFFLPRNGRTGQRPDPLASLPDVDARFRHIWNHLSPTARELAAYCSAAPVSLPVIRLIQSAMQPGRASQLHVAELLTIGLFEPLTPFTGSEHPDEIVYDFIDGQPMRERWLNTTYRARVADVFDRVTTYIGRLAGKEYRDVALLVSDLLEGQAELNPASRAFARLTPIVLHNLGRPDLAEAVSGRLRGGQEVGPTTAPAVRLIYERPLMPKLPSRPTAAALSEPWLAVGLENGDILVQDVRESEPTAPLKGRDQGAVRSLAFSPDGSHLAAGFEKGTIVVWRGSGNRVFNEREALSGPVTHLAHLRDGPLLAAVSGAGELEVYDYEKNHSLTSSRPHAGPAHHVVQAGEFLITSGADGRVHFSQANRLGEPLFSLPDHQAEITWLAADQDGRRLATGDAQGRLWLWDIHRYPERPLLLWAIQAHEKALTSLAFHPHLPFLVTTGLDKTLAVWDIRRPPERPLQTARGEPGWGERLLFGEDGRQLYTIGPAPAVHRWGFDVDEPAAEPAAAAPAEWLVLLYVPSDDSKIYRVAQQMVERINQVTLNDRVQMVVQWFWPDGERLSLNERQKENSTFTDGVMARRLQADIVDPQTLVDFVGWARETFPARRTILVYFGYGSGYGVDQIVPNHLPMIALDRRNKGGIDLLALKEALSTIKQMINRPIDLLILNTSFWAQVEVGWELREEVSWLVASQDNLPGTGMPLDALLGDLVEQPQGDLWEITQRFAASFEKYYRENELDYSQIGVQGATITAVDISELESLIAQIATLSQILKQVENDSELLAFVREIHRQTIEFQGTFKSQGLYDLKMFAAQLVDEALSFAEGFQTTLSGLVALLGEGGAVAAHRYSADHYRPTGGLSIYCPLPGGEAPLVDAYQETDFDRETGWYAFLQAYHAAARAADEPPADAPPRPQAVFMTDVSIPDGTVIEPGATFTKVWRLRNRGSAPWGEGFILAFRGGDSLGIDPAVPLPPAAPGEEVDVAVEMTAPEAPGRYLSTWTLRDDRGRNFGDQVYADIIVTARGDQAPPPAAFPEGHALVIAIDQNLNNPRLDMPAALTEARQVANLLVDTWGYRPSQVTFLTGPQATRDRIIDALTELALRLDAASTAFIFWVGHSYPAADGRTVLYTYDSLLEQRRLRPGSGLTQGEINQLLARLPGQTCLVIDSNYGRRDFISLPSERFFALLAETSYVQPGASASVFGQAVIDALRRPEAATAAGELDPADLYDDVSGEVPRRLREIGVEPVVPSVLASTGGRLIIGRRAAAAAEPTPNEAPTPRPVGLLSRQIVNYEAEQALFRDLFDPNGSLRIVLLEGTSGSGKSYLLREGLEVRTGRDNALIFSLSSVPENRQIVEFLHLLADRLGMHEEADQLLGPESLFSIGGDEIGGDIVLTTPPADPQMTIDSAKISITQPGESALPQRRAYLALLNLCLAELDRRSGPYLLIIDDYEKASVEFDDWLRFDFLPLAAQRAPLRLVIAGRQTPAFVPEWEKAAVWRELKGISDAGPWQEWLADQGIDLPSPDFIEKTIAATGGNPRMMMQALSRLVNRPPEDWSSN